ncbi:hypothetical protein [Paenibacillus naphthalenovorans]|uniref:Uncharacterized protein n=1 Tax=Paenibacillus naphthalenovorans TaxID=162209 RepID=A0A0U2W0S9_9BACL|nr:hypothetical protein [Paenibacillus naphthalenovorans]ALS22132.1 hypothetical protein IJ22_17580 [Paenibacillus naphthalenovorans]
MNDETRVTFTQDEKEILLKSIKDISFVAASLYEWIKKDALTEGMRKTIPSLIESHFTDIAERLNYSSTLIEDEKKRYDDIRNANIKIRELEQRLADHTDIDGIPKVLENLYWKVYGWWRDYGFNHVSDFQFTSYGSILCNFSFMLSSRTSTLFSKSPASDRQRLADYIELLKSKGYEMIKEDGYDWKVLDTENNRKLLIDLLKNRFPSIHIHKFESNSLRNTNHFYIWRIEALIKNIKDVIEYEST